MPVPATCLAKDTLITMADYSQKRIDELKIGDKLLSFNFETGQHEMDELLTINHPVHSNFVRIVLTDFCVNCTPDHPFFSKGWVSVNPYRTELYYRHIESARELKQNMLLKSLSGDKEVLFITRYEKEQTSYNISRLKNNFTYYANGLLTAIE